MDQAVRLALPDRSARRLFHLYRGELDVEESGLEDVLDRTDGVTASFLKELLRRAAVRAADNVPDSTIALRVKADDLQAALDELLDVNHAMTRTVLGSVGSPDPVA